jgi:RNA polymerase sigma factor (sigma-70 family)
MRLMRLTKLRRARENMREQEKQERFFARIKPHQGILYKVARAYCYQEEERQDLEQEMLLQLWRSIDRFDSKSQFSTWMYRVVLNVALSYERERRLQQKILMVDSASIDDALEPRPSDNAAVLYQLLGRLDPLEKALIVLYLEGNNHEVIGDILGISETNVSTKIGRIKQRLREELK